MKVVPSLQFRSATRNRGVALVITLVLLSVITFMAVAFLVLSRSERGAVATSTDQLHAKLANEAGLERAKAEILASMIAFTNRFDYGLKVSTNYINPIGFISGNPTLTNVSWTYANGAPLNPGDTLQNLSNLFYYPRPPVFVTNRFAANSMDFRFYLDLNRNGLYETNGWLPVMNPIGTFYHTNGNFLDQITAGVTLSNFFVGDPEWVGGLEYPDRRHSADNRFLWRYAYVVVPEGKTLDLNAVHNYARKSGAPDMPPGQGDRFWRNQGVGTWEANLAAFLTDLNTNFWPYPQGTIWGAPYFYDYLNYDNGNRGAAFDDALSVLRFRYAGNRQRSLASVSQLFGTRGTTLFSNDRIDGYSSGPLMTNSWWTITTDSDLPNTPWSGADNTNHFFTPQDLFNEAKIYGGQNLAQNQLTLPRRLYYSGTNTGSYDRYTFYRLMSQLGTDSGTEPDNRINVNYSNKVEFINGVPKVTKMDPWTPEDFFRRAADRLLAEGTPKIQVNGKQVSLSVTNIPIYPTNYYTASVNRLLQLAANIYDATTNRPIAPNIQGLQIGLPTVFRPLFARDGTNVFISGYEQVRTLQDLTANRMIMRDLGNPSDMGIAWGPYDMVYGVPFIVGAKKGYPNFNEFSMQNIAEVTRKLEFRRSGIGGPVNETNQMYIVGLSNIFAVEAWNSYTNPFPRQLTMRVAADVSLVFSNEVGNLISNQITSFFVTNITQNTWQGLTKPGAFQIPLSNAVTFLPPSVYRHSSRTFVPVGRPNSAAFERNQGFPIPNWWMTVRPKLRFTLTTPHPDGGDAIVDYVNLAGEGDTIFLPEVMMREGVINQPDPRPGSMWTTNRLNGRTDFRVATYGILSQIQASLGNLTVNNWDDFLLDPTVGRDRLKAIDSFRKQYDLAPLTYKNLQFAKSNIFYAPLVPRRTVFQTVTWQANDPLVHYTIGDLTDVERTNNVSFVRPNPILPNLGEINTRYEPWGGSPIGKSTSPTMYALQVKDPLVRKSDDWEFPTNKFPNIGWIGRVHRGTPWQTVYLKSAPVDIRSWMRWSGNAQRLLVDGKVEADARFTLPIRDRHLVDIFTAALNENASRGQLSVNQDGLAAWSAVLSGVVVVTNVIPDAEFAKNPLRNPEFGWNVIQPAGAYDPNEPTPVARIVNAINQARSTNFPNKVFTRLGDLLSVPELTVGANPRYVGTYPNGFWTGVSPFINLGNPGEMDPNAADPQSRYSVQQLYGISEAAYERLPQQILGLVRGEQHPRFVVYSYGQALKPADRSLVTSGPFTGMATNYQITAEVATRAVVRVEGAPEAPKVIVEQYNVLPPE